jgi:hypothetical protein
MKAYGLLATVVTVLSIAIPQFLIADQLCTQVLPYRLVGSANSSAASKMILVENLSSGEQEVLEWDKPVFKKWRILGVSGSQLLLRSTDGVIGCINSNYNLKSLAGGRETQARVAIPIETSKPVLTPDDAAADLGWGVPPQITTPPTDVLEIATNTITLDDLTLEDFLGAGGHAAYATFGKYNVGILIEALGANSSLLRTAGVEKEDVIMKINGAHLESTQDLLTLARFYKDSPLVLTVQRGSKTINISVLLKPKKQ